jgi:hypothetical protein
MMIRVITVTLRVPVAINWRNSKLAVTKLLAHPPVFSCVYRKRVRPPTCLFTRSGKKGPNVEPAAIRCGNYAPDGRDNVHWSRSAPAIFTPARRHISRFAPVIPRRGGGADRFLGSTLITPPTSLFMRSHNNPTSLFRDLTKKGPNVEPQRSRGEFPHLTAGITCTDLAGDGVAVAAGDRPPRRHCSSFSGAHRKTQVGSAVRGGR